MAYMHATGAGRLSGNAERRQLRRAAIASTIGTTMEWYDAILYGLAVPLYLGRLFFPSHDPLTSILAGNVALVASFLARPVGAAIFGRFGDRMGRKSTLIVTLLVGGLACVAIGALPTFADIGVAAPAMLFVLRLLIGASLGGEWGGAVLLTLEWANRGGRRGLWTSFPQVGTVAATVLGLVAFQVAALLFGTQSSWAWRVPFLASIVLVGIGLYLRLGVLETPTFVKIREERRTEHDPVREAWRRNKRELLLTALLRMGEQAPLVLFTTFFLIYTAILGVPRPIAISISILSGLVGAVATIFFGYVSDLAGRRRTFTWGAVAMLVWALPYFGLVGTREVPPMLIAAVVGQVIVAAMSGPEAALIAESFTGRFRYSGAGLGAGIGAPLAGGAASLLGPFLFQRFHSGLPVALYMMGCALISLVAVALLRERSALDLNVEYEQQRTDMPAPAAERA